LPSFVLANALLISADAELDSIPGLKWARWVDDYALHGSDLDTIRKALKALEGRLGKLGLQLSAAKTHVGSPRASVFTDTRLATASDEVKGDAEVASDEADTFLEVCDEILGAPWAASVRDVSFVVTRLKHHPELFDESRWAKATQWMPHAAEHLARLARHYESFRDALESELPAMIEGAWAGQSWAQVKLLGAWPSAPRRMVPILRQHLAETLREHPATTPTLAYLLADEVPLSELQKLAAGSNDWLSHRALWLCAGQAGASAGWLKEQLARFEDHVVLGAAWEAWGSALFERDQGDRPKMDVDT
jgi:hypothetical protein